MSAEALLERQTRAREAIRLRVEAIVTRAWTSLGSWDRADIDTFLDMVVPLIGAAQLQTATVTDIYLAGLLSEVLGEEVIPLGVDIEGGLRPTPPDEVYRRPFVEHWTALKNGAAFESALAIGLDRLVRLADDDLGLAHRRAALTVVGADDRVTGYRRVIRPERASGGSCGLCVAASQQRYGKAELMPLHSRCHCDVMPIVRTGSGSVTDPGRRVNDEDVADIYRQAKAEKRLTDFRYKVEEHGELGPVLRKEGETFTGLADIAA